MPKGRQTSHVKQSHDPERSLYSHVVQSPKKERVQVIRKLGLKAPASKAQLRASLADAAKRTSRG